jgi:ATP-binding cassette subfamily B protein
LKEIHLEEFRKSVALVPQEVFLFSDTIRNNVSFGSLVPVSDEEIIEVLKLAHVWHNIELFPQGLDTQLGELGINLSGGQKQRINIARALIRKPKLLILDDCLSAVDTETENTILHNLAQLPYKPTIVMVGHRISSLGNCRKIIALDHGKIIEMGRPEELIQRKGFYYDLVEQQKQDPTPSV